MEPERVRTAGHSWQGEMLCAMCNAKPPTVQLWFRWGLGIAESGNVVGRLVCDDCVVRGTQQLNGHRGALRAQGMFVSLTKLWRLNEHSTYVPVGIFNEWRPTELELEE